MTPIPRKQSLTPFLLVLFALVILRRAWVSDDAYITFRTVDNFLHGYGLVWNVGERVQAYTHPLWMFLLVGANALTREIHFTSLALSIFISCTALGLLATRNSTSHLAAAFAILALTLSKAFVDYSTSGLENPLSHLLLVLFVFVLLAPPNPKTPFWLALLTSFILLTRLDLILLIAPACLLFLSQNFNKPTLRQLMLGSLPFLAWEIFSLFYYGFPLPNTYYAKLSTGIPQIELTRQGIQYLLNALEFDPLTPLLILAGLLAAFTLRTRKTTALALGLLLYLAYVVRIGGDFMAGRFLTVPLLLAVILLSRLDFDTLPLPQTLLIFALPLIIGLTAPDSTLDFRDTTTLQTPSEHVDHRGISDERLNYAPYTAPLALPRDAIPPTHVWAWQGTRDAGSDRKLATKFGIGFYGYNAGPSIYIIDQLALADPLLARLPARRDIHWRVGHYTREIPGGYERTLETGKNALKDSDLAIYYTKLTLIIRGPLLSKSRLLEIIKINLGMYNDLIHQDKYRYPDLLRIPATNIPSLPPAPDLLWNAPGMIPFTDSGLEITWDSPQSTLWLEISLSSDDAFLLSYSQNGQELATQTLPAVEYPEAGLAVHRILLPSRVQTAGFDTLRILPIHGEGFSLGHIQVPQP